MKKLIRALLFTMVLVFGLTTSVFAATGSALEAGLQGLGLSDNEIANIMEYLQTIHMTVEQENSLLAYVNQAESVAGGTSDLNTLPSEKKQELKVIAEEAAAVVGLNAVFTTDSSGRVVLSLVKPNGGVLVTLTNANAANVQWDALRSVITNARIYSQEAKSGGNTSPSNPSKGSGSSSSSSKYVPKKGGGYCKTATNTGKLLLAGLGLVAISGGIIIKRKKALRV